MPIRLPEDRWEHIVRRHPEMRWQRARVMDASAAPDIVQRGDYGALLAARYYNSDQVQSTFSSSQCTGKSAKQTASSLRRILHGA